MGRVVVVGGGITGLSTAHALVDKHGIPGRDVTLVEGSPRLGGNVRTRERDGFLIDPGPDSWIAYKPAGTALAKALGLGDRLIDTLPQSRRAYIVAVRSKARGPELFLLPEGLSLGVPTKLWPMVKTPLLSWSGKIRAAFDFIEPVGFRRKTGEGGDESVGSFIQRRVGREVLDRLAGPLLGGLFAGDVQDLSLQATFPQLIPLEIPGGLVRGARQQMKKAQANRPKGGPTPSIFTSLRGGIGELVSAMVARLEKAEVELRLSTPARKLERLPDGDPRGRFALGVGTDDVVFADHVVFAGPAHVAAKILVDLDEKVAAPLGEIPYGSSATVFFAYREADVPRKLDATGYLVPKSLGRAANAATWVSSKWPHRAPEGHHLVRVFFGADYVDRDDAELVRLAREENAQTIGATADPLFHVIDRFHRASPQPRVGHPARIRAVKERLAALGSLHVCGSAYDGVGIADCVRQAQAVAEAIAKSASAVTPG